MKFLHTVCIVNLKVSIVACNSITDTGTVSSVCYSYQLSYEMKITTPQASKWSKIFSIALFCYGKEGWNLNSTQALDSSILEPAIYHNLDAYSLKVCLILFEDDNGTFVSCWFWRLITTFLKILLIQAHI